MKLSIYIAIASMVRSQMQVVMIDSTGSFDIVKVLQILQNQTDGGTLLFPRVVFY